MIELGKLIPVFNYSDDEVTTESSNNPPNIDISPNAGSTLYWNYGYTPVYTEWGATTEPDEFLYLFKVSQPFQSATAHNWGMVTWYKKLYFASAYSKKKGGDIMADQR